MDRGTRYDENGHVDYPHEDGCLPGCPCTPDEEDD